MNFLTSDENFVVGICWNCGKELRIDDPKFFVNDEVWCERCADNGVGLYMEDDCDEQ